MGKIVGNVVIVFLLCATIFVDAARVTMKLRTENDSNQVVIGQPFVIEVTVEYENGSVSDPRFKGLEGVTHADAMGIHMMSINGKATARYSYGMRIDAVGSYLLGPAIVQYQKQELVSNEVRVNVVKDPGIVAQKNSAEHAKAFLRLKVEPETAVVGQKISCCLRFYHQDDAIREITLHGKELSSFIMKNASAVERGKAVVQGVPYEYAQLRWDLYPTKPGEFMVPACSADYAIPSKYDNYLMSFAAPLFGRPSLESKRIYSNAAAIKVVPLPYFDGEVHAIGVFERFSASIKPGIAKEGEGMVLTLEIEGTGDLQAIKTPQLNMPDALKYYDSNSVVIAPQHDDELPKKRFEFIVQGMKAGDYEIPEQLFNYFDIERHTFVTLRTPPLAVSITPGVTTAMAKKDTSLPGAAEHEEKKSEDTEDIAAINVIGEWYYVEQRQPLRWWVFHILMLLPALYVGYPTVVEWYYRRVRKSTRLLRRHAFKKAHKKIDQAIRLHDDACLYALFTELFQELNCTIERGTIAQWDDFFERIAHAAYAQATKSKNSGELCRMAKEWLERLEKIV